jgi:ABC-type transport system involved in multi-copper enzyme maturation permease subunit
LSLTIVAAAVVGIGAIVAAVRTSGSGGLDALSGTFTGVLVAQLAVGVLGVLMITSEYSTGMIRSTFIAAPQRRTVIVAKAGVVGLVTFVVATVTSFAAFFVSSAILSSHGTHLSLGSPGALRSVIGVGLYLGILAVLALGLGTIIRSSAGGIAALVGLLLVLPALSQAIPASVRDTVDKFLPANAGQSMFFHSDTASLSPWIGLLVLAGYAVATLGTALVMVRRRDA